MAKVTDELESNLPQPKAKRTRKPVEKIAGASKPDDYVRIILQNSSEVGPNGHFFGINGRGYILKPGIPVDVPRGLLDILNNAIKDEPILDPNTQQVVGWQKQMRFAYTVLSEGSQRAA